MELVADLQLRSVKKVQVTDASFAGSSPISLQHKRLAASSKYGITLALVGKNKILSWKSAELNGSSGDGNQPNRREILYPFNAQSEAVSVDVSADGSVLAICVNTTNGPFAHLFDVRCFSPQETRQPFPLAAIRLSTNSGATVVCFEWNPCPSPPIFVASTSDHNLLSIQYDFENGSGFTILGSTATKARVICISWSPKGKQLSVGDSEGRIHQYKPELAPIRTLDPPHPAAQCIALSWLATTEWLAAYLLPNSGVVVSLLVQKKGQPQQWMPYPTLNLASIAATAPPSVAFLPMTEWRMVFVYSTCSSTVDVIGLSGEHWVHFEFDQYDIQLPPLEGTNAETFPAGACLDLTSTKSFDYEGGREVSAQPCLLFLTAHGLLTSYAAVAPNATRPAINKAVESYQEGQARFGNPPPGYQPLYQPAITAVPQAQPKPQVFARVAAPLPNPIPVTTTTPTSALVAAAAISTESRERAEQARRQELEGRFKQSISDYCRVRNAHAGKVDVLRELRGKVEESCSSSVNEDEIDSLFESVISIYHSLEDAESDLDATRSRLLRSTEFVNDIEIAEKEGRDKSGKLRNGSYSSDVTGSDDGGHQHMGEAIFAKLQKERTELLRDRFEELMDKVEGVQKGLDALDLDGTGGQRKSTNWQLHTALLPEEQAEFNRMSSEVAKGTRKLSTRLSQLQHSVRLLNAMRDAKKDAASSGRGGKDDGGLGDDQVADYVAKMAEVLIVSPATPHYPRRLNSSTHGSDKLSATGGPRLRQLLKSLGNPPITKVPCQFPLQSSTQPTTDHQNGETNGAPFADKRSVALGISENDLVIASKLAQAVCCTPRKAPTVSIGTQSPEWRKGTATGRPQQIASTPPGIPPTARTVPDISTPQAAAKTAVANAATSLKPPQLECAAVPALPPRPVATASKPASIEALVQTQGVGSPVTKVEVEFAPAPAIASTTHGGTGTTPSTTASSSEPEKPVLFSFKPPSTTATAPSVGALVAPSTTAATGNDDGMMEEEPVRTAGGPNVSFNFNQTGLGSSIPQNQNASPFGGLNLANRVQSQSTSAGSNWPFGGGTTSTQPATTGSLFQSPTPSAPAAAPAFGAFNGQAASSNTSPFGNKPAFGGGAIFGTASPFSSGSASSPFGAGQSTTSFGQPQQQGGVFSSKPAFGTAGAPAAGGTTSTSGFTAFANRSAAFGQLAQSAAPPLQQQTSPFGGMNQSGGGFGSFGASPTASGGFNNQTSSTLHSSPAFTMMRK